jgi:hypothetical protein
MSKTFSKKSAVLFAGVMAVCALALPSMASAASWSGTLGDHTFDSTNANNRLSFSVGAPVTAGSTCGVSQFTLTVTNAFDAHIDGAIFQNCMGQGNSVNCTVTPTGTNFPWTVTNRLTSHLEIHNVDVDVFFENTPGNATACALPGNVRLTGTLTGGSWSNTNSEITLTNATGLTGHFPSPIGPQPATVSGTLRDTANTLKMVD